MSEVIVTKDNFKEEVLDSNIPVLVDFWAGWCGPCMMLAPTIEEVAKELEGRVKVCKINVDENGELAMQYGVVSIPTLFVFKNGQVANQSIGFVPKEAVLDLVK